MVYFKCQDPDCSRGEKIPQNIVLSFQNSEGRTVRKCPYCRGRLKLLEAPWSHSPDKDYLPVEECRDGYLYFIRARNAFIGIYNEKNKSFIISRDKYKDNFLDEEDHWDTDEQHGTVNPLLELEKAPVFEDDEKKLAWLNSKREFYKPV